MTQDRKQVENAKQLQRKRLHNDFLAVLQELKDAGAREPWIQDFVTYVHRLPMKWKLLSRETMPQRCRRYEKLCKKFDLLAKAIEKDPEWSKMQVDGHDGIFEIGFVELKGRPRIHEWLRDLSETIASTRDSFPRFERKRDLNNFVLLEIYSVLGDVQRISNRNRSAERMAGFVLNKEIPPGTVVQARKYHKE